MMHAAAVAKLIRVDNEWRAFDANGALIATAPIVVLANGSEAIELADLAYDSMQRVRDYHRGTLLGARVVVSGAGYVLPAIDGIAVVGATYDFQTVAGKVRRAHRRLASRQPPPAPGHTFHALLSIDAPRINQVAGLSLHCARSDAGDRRGRRHGRGTYQHTVHQPRRIFDASGYVPGHRFRRAAARAAPNAGNVRIVRLRFTRAVVDGVGSRIARQSNRRRAAAARRRIARRDRSRKICAETTAPRHVMIEFGAVCSGRRPRNPPRPGTS